MSLIISNINYDRQLDSTQTNFLKGTAGEWVRLQLDFQVFPYLQPDRGGAVTFLTPDICRLDDGTTWSERGFKVGDSLIWQSDEVNTNDNSVNPITYNFDIVDIDDNIFFLTETGSASLVRDISLPGVQYIRNGIQYTRQKNVIYLDDVLNIEGFEIDFAKIKNSDRGLENVFSALDGTTPTFTIDGAINVNDTAEGEIHNTKTGSCVAKLFVKRVANEAITVANVTLSNAHKYELTILYNIAGFGEGFNFDDETSPDYFFDKEALTDAIKINCFRDLDDRSTSVQLQRSLKKGTTGYLGEKFRGTPSLQKASNVRYYDVNGDDDFSLSFNARSSVKFVIDNVTNTSKYNFGLAVIPQSYDSGRITALEKYKLVTGLHGLENSTANTIRTDNFTSYTNGVYNLTSEGYGGIDLEHISIQQLTPSTVEVTLRFNPTDFDANEDTNFCIFANVDGISSVQVDYQSFKEFENVIGTLQGDVKFFPSYLDISSDTGISNPDLTIVQDVTMKGYVRLTRETDLVEKLEFRVEAVKGNLEYTLQSFEIEVGENVNLDVLQYNEVSDISGLLPDRNEIKFNRNTTYDDLIYKGYDIQYPFRIRWEDWIERVDTPDIWQDLSKLNSGKNNNWIDYTELQDTRITVSILSKVADNFFKSTYDITPRDFNSSPDVTTLIEVYRTSDNALLWTETDSDGFDNGFLISAVDMYVKATHTLSSGSWDASSIADCFIERRNQNGQYEIQRLESNNLTINSNVLEQEFNLLGSLISDEFDYVIYSRSYNFYDDATGIGGIGGYNPFDNNFDGNFSVNPV